MTEKILVVEGEANSGDMLWYQLVRAGFWVKTANNGRVALQWIKSQAPTLVLLDLMAPGISGWDVCRIIKSDPLTRPVGVVVLSAQPRETDRIRALEMGADDYLARPCDPRELVLRIKAILRRGSLGDGKEEHLRVGDLLLDRSRHEVKAADRLVACTATEFKLLGLLMERQGRIQTRDRLLNDVWGYDAVIETRTVDVHMRRLREKLGPFACYIETVRGFGYRIASR